MITATFTENPTTADDYGNFYYKKNIIKEKESEICETCHTIIMNILEYRNIKLLRLAEDCRTLFVAPSKEKDKK